MFQPGFLYLNTFLCVHSKGPATWAGIITLSAEKPVNLGNRYLKDSGQRAVGSVGTLLVREPPAPEAVHGVGGDGLAELLEGVVPVPALFDLVQQFGQFARHRVVWEEGGGAEKTVRTRAAALNHSLVGSFSSLHQSLR